MIGLIQSSVKIICCRCVITDANHYLAYLVIILICLYTVQNIKGLDAVRLSDLKVKQSAIISKVNRTLDGEISSDLVASRLETLGFIPGTKVQVITKGIFGGDPILIQIGFTRFALRKNEAEKIEIQLDGAST